jgi:peptidoglycan/LPS O-acetylase OafA/YrhL
MSESETSKPWWWKPLWICSILSTIIVSIVGYILWNGSFFQAAGLMITLFVIGVAYYIRVRASQRINRVIFIVLGVTPIGFIMFVVTVFVVNQTLLAGTSGRWPFVVILAVICFSLGAIIGDWLGKKRNYILPLTP